MRSDVMSAARPFKAVDPAWIKYQKWSAEVALFLSGVGG